MVEIYYNFGDNVKPAMVVPQPAAPLTDVVTLQNGSTVIVDGSLEIGTAVAPYAADDPLIAVLRGSTLIVDGDLNLYRDVAAANPLIFVDSSSKLIVTGDSDLSRAGAGAAGVILASVDSLVKFIGTVDLLAHGGVIAADGSFLTASRNSIAYFGQLLFNGGADLDLDDFATILLEYHSQLHVTDVPGASDALNTSNPAGASVTGIRLSSGSEAFLDPYAANTGIGSAAAAANGRDVHVGGAAAAADWAGAEVLTDLGAATPEICMVHKP